MANNHSSLVDRRFPSPEGEPLRVVCVAPGYLVVHSGTNPHVPTVLPGVSHVYSISMKTLPTKCVNASDTIQNGSGPTDHYDVE
jgi:hypothetical protein